MIRTPARDVARSIQDGVDSTAFMKTVAMNHGMARTGDSASVLSQVVRRYAAVNLMMAPPMRSATIAEARVVPSLTLLNVSTA